MSSMKIMRFINLSLALALGAGLAACNQQGNERLAEKAGIEGEASAQKQIQVEMQNLERRSKEMEADLAILHRFHQAVSGTYEGTIQNDRETYSLRVIFVPSLSPYGTSRVRSLEEITADLNNLHLNAQVIQWNPANPLSAVGCRIQGVHPDVRKGQITLTSENCPNLYALGLSDPSFSGRANLENSSHLASQVTEGKLGAVSQFDGYMQPTTNATLYKVVLSKVEGR